MTDIKLIDVGNEQNAFVIDEDGDRLAEMVIRVRDKTMIVYHTEVSPKMEGQGIAKQLLERMVEYAKENQLKVVPLCSYVHAQFKRHPDLYESVWEK